MRVSEQELPIGSKFGTTAKPARKLIALMGDHAVPRAAFAEAVRPHGLPPVINTVSMSSGLRLFSARRTGQFPTFIPDASKDFSDENVQIREGALKAARGIPPEHGRAIFAFPHRT